MNKDILQNYYDTFINQEDQRTFLNGLADYVGFVLEDEDGKRIISDIEKTKQTLLDEKVRLENIVADEVKTEQGEYSKIKEVSKISTGNEDADKILYSKTHPQLTEVERKIKEGQEIAVWGAWDKLYVAYLAVYRKEDELERLQQDNNNFWIPKLVKKVASDLPSKIVSECKSYVMRIHNYLLNQMADITAELPKKEENNTALSQSEIQEVKSILIVAREPSINNDKVWLVFNGDFSNGIQFSASGKRGIHSYIKTLYDVAKGIGIGVRIDYNSAIASTINSKIFKRKGIREKYRQTTIVEKDGYKYKLNKGITISATSRGLLMREQLKDLPRD